MCNSYSQREIQNWPPGYMYSRALVVADTVTVLKYVSIFMDYFLTPPTHLIPIIIVRRQTDVVPCGVIFVAQYAEEYVIFCQLQQLYFIYRICKCKYNVENSIIKYYRPSSTFS